MYIAIIFFNLEIEMKYFHSSLLILVLMLFPV